MMTQTTNSELLEMIKWFNAYTVDRIEDGQYFITCWSTTECDCGNIVNDDGAVMHINLSAENYLENGSHWLKRNGLVKYGMQITERMWITEDGDACECDACAKD